MPRNGRQLPRYWPSVRTGGRGDQRASAYRRFSSVCVTITRRFRIRVLKRFIFYSSGGGVTRVWRTVATSGALIAKSRKILFLKWYSIFKRFFSIVCFEMDTTLCIRTHYVRIR